MFGSSLILPFLTMTGGALLGRQIYGADGWFTGGEIGLGVGCVVLAVVWLLFALLDRWAGPS